MRIAIISDIHGNLPALKAVLKNIEANSIDQIICLGDLVDFAPWPNEVIDLIRSLRIMTIMGNHDERIAFDLPIIPLAKHNPKETEARNIAIANTKKVISKSNRAYLASLQKNIVFNFDAFSIHLTHASPKNISEYLYEDDLSLLEERVNSIRSDVLVIGHTHLSYIKELGEKKIVNVGSVGRSKEADRMACYSIIEISSGEQLSIEMIKVKYSIHDTIMAIYRSEIPDFYADFLSNHNT